MPPSRSCRRLSSMLVREGRAAGVARIDPEALQQPEAARAAGLEPDLVEPQDVAVGVPVGTLADLVERIHQRLELAGQLGEYPGQRTLAAARGGMRERAVGTPAHGDV